jgi:6-phosphogluconolactonase (cycloisomerase 2 family)
MTYRALGVFAFAAALGACTKAPSALPVDTTPPTVTAATPANGATAVAVDTPMSIVFSKPMDSASVKLVATPSIQFDPATWNPDGQLMTCHPYALAVGRIYKVTVTGKDVAGNAMAPFTFSFTTVDTTPTVTAIVPANGASGVPVDSSMSVTFSQPMDTATVNVVATPTIQFDPPTWDAAGQVMTCHPRALAMGTNYTITVTGKDLAEIAMTPFTASFTVVPACTLSGTVSSLTGTGLVLQDNIGDSLEYSGNGSLLPFTFATPIACGQHYEVSVATQPSVPTQNCSISNASGTLSSATNVAVTCTSQSPRFALVANGKGVYVHTVNAGTGLLRARSYAVAAQGNYFTRYVSVDPSGAFAYVVSLDPGTSPENGTIAAFTVDASTGAVTSVGTLAAGTNTKAVVFHPSGKFAYVTNDAGIMMLSYNGALTSTAVSTAAPPTSFSTDPRGKFAYVTGTNDGVGIYAIGSDGKLTSAGTGAGGTHPTSVSIHPSGRFAYLTTSSAANGVMVYGVDSTTGALTYASAVGTGYYPPRSLSIDPSGAFALVSGDGGSGSGRISTFKIDPMAGALTNVSSVTTTTNFPGPIAIDPSGMFVYAADLYNGISSYTMTNAGFLTAMGALPGNSIAVTAAWAPVTYVPKFAYAAMYSSTANNIKGYSISSDTGALTATAWSSVPAGTNPSAIAVDPTGRFAYVANWGSGDVWAYTIDDATGALTRMTAAGGTMPAGTNPTAIAVDPFGRFVYVANYGSGNVLAYTINPSTGALAQVSGTGGMVTAGTSPSSIAIDPYGRFVYATNLGSGDVSAYGINPSTGGLASLGANVAGGTSPGSITVDPSGKFAYAGGTTDVRAYTIGTSGTLTSIGTPVTGSAVSIAVEPTGKRAYALGSYAGVAIYNIGNDGTLTSAGAPETVDAHAPYCFTIDPSGKFAYFVNWGGGPTILAYSIYADTGALTAVNSLGTGGNAKSMAIMAAIK